MADEDTTTELTPEQRRRVDKWLEISETHEGALYLLAKFSLQLAETERQLEAARISCPVNREKQCPGKLELSGHRTTDMGYNGIDRNSVTQYYTCGTCGVKVKRAWAWEDVGYEH
jgi:hypothetical protein